MLDTAELEAIHEFPLTKDSVVWIVGAYGGKTAQFYEKKYDPYIHLFEPQPPFAQTLREMFKDNPKVAVHCFGLRDKWGSAQMACEGSDGATFLFPKDYAGPLSSPMRFMDVADWLWSDLDLLHLNCEGGEWEILPRLLDTDLIKRVKYLMVQFHPRNEDFQPFFDIKIRIEKEYTNITDKGHTWQTWRRNG